VDTVPDPWMTVAEVATAYGVKENTLRSWLRRGVGPAHYRMNGMIRLRTTDVAAWFEDCRR